MKFESNWLLMGNDVAGVMDALPSTRAIKVHAHMCMELRKLVVRVSKTLLEIEAAGPYCSSGIDALCLLNNGLVKAKSVLQQCSESSVLYLALIGDAIVSRCERSKNLFEQSLGQIQNMVPLVLAAKIFGVIADLRSATFSLDSCEEESGRVLQELLRIYGSTDDSNEENALAAIHAVSLHLRLSSHKAILIEKRSIRKLLDKLGEGAPNKRSILIFFLNLLHKYGRTLAKGQRENESFGREEPLPSHCQLARETELCEEHMPSRLVPPGEFICPLSSRLMHDPVIIFSGKTYERMFIQKWLDEGNDTCPMTNIKLAHFSLTSNTLMKDLISKWCAIHDVSIMDPNVQDTLAKSCETSTNSVSSLSSSMNNLNLPLDLSNASMGFSHGSDLSIDQINGSFKSLHEKCTELLSGSTAVSWDSQCNAVQDAKRLLLDNDESSEKLVPQFIRFLKDADTLHDKEAKMAGCLLLLERVQKHGNWISSFLNQDAYDLLASFLDTDVSMQALSILETLSSNQHCCHEIAKSRAFVRILNLLDLPIQELHQSVLQILSHLCSAIDISSFIAPSDLILKLLPLFQDPALATFCITILKNLSEKEEGRMWIAETDGCIACIIKLLDKDDVEVQEHAVSVLVSLCSQRLQYCQFVMDEGVIPDLVSVSVNGNIKAKAMAIELLRILKEAFSTRGESSGTNDNIESNKQCNVYNYKAPSTARGRGLFRKIFYKRFGVKNMIS